MSKDSKHMQAGPAKEPEAKKPAGGSGGGRHFAAATATVPTADEKPHRHSGKKIVLGIIIALVVILAAGYAGASVYFSSHFLPGTTVNGVDASLMTTDQLKQALDDDLASFSTNVSNEDGSFSLDIPAENVDLQSDTASLAQEASQQMPGAEWPVKISSPATIELDQVATCDHDQLSQIVKTAVDAFNQTATQPQGSHVAYDEASGTFKASDASYGTALDSGKVASAATTAVEALEPSVKLGQDQLLAPTETQTTDQVVAAVDAANKLVSGDIQLMLNGKEAARLTPAQMAAWISVDDDMNVVFDSDAATKWVDDTLSPAVDYSDDKYDWKVSTPKMVQLLSDEISAGSTDPIKIPMYKEIKVPDETAGAAALGRHIDVNLGTQYARLYDDSGKVIWESFIVSGNASEGRNTPTGTFAINNKMKDITLVGADENHDGKPDYKSKVKYWMAFVGSSVGLHDAPWRSNFGGDIYRYNGSHGCVNLPSAKAAELYDLVKVGDKVVVHN